MTSSTRLIVCLLCVALISGCSQSLLCPVAKAPVAPAPLDVRAEAYYEYLAAQQYVNEKKYDKAIEAYGKALRIDPCSPVLQTELAVLYLHQNRLDPALELLEQAIRTSPDRPKPYLLLGQVYVRKGRLEDAERSFNRAIELNPSATEAYLMLGALYAQQSHFNKAIETFDRLAGKVPENPMPLYYKARIFLDMKYYDQAEQILKQLLAKEPGFEDGMLDLAYIYEVTDHPREAERTYLEILEANPANSQALCQAWKSLYAPGQGRRCNPAVRPFAQNRPHGHGKPPQGRDYPPSAEKLQGRRQPILRPCLRLIPNTTRLSIIWRLPTRKCSITAMRYATFPPSRCQARFGVRPSRAWPWCMYKLKDYNNGARVLNGAIAKNPGENDLYLFLAIVYEDANSNGEAIKALDRGLKVLPGNSGLLFRKGVILGKMGKENEAVDTMRQILAVEPRNADALNFIGYSYADRGIHLLEAKELILEALSVSPKDGYIMDSLGWVYFKLGRRKKALDALLEAVRLVPNDPVVQEHLGDVYAKLGEKAKATEAYRKAILLNGSAPGGLRAKLDAIR